MLFGDETGHVRQILHDLCSGGLQRRDAAVDFLKLALNAILPSLKAFEVFQYQNHTSRYSMPGTHNKKAHNLCGPEPSNLFITS